METATSTTQRAIAAAAVAKPKAGGRPHSASRPQPRDAIGGLSARRARFATQTTAVSRLRGDLQ